MLQRLCANQIDMAVDRSVYTAMLNARGGFESDVTVTRLSHRAVPHRHRFGPAACGMSPGSVAASRADESDVLTDVGALWIA